MISNLKIFLLYCLLFGFSLAANASNPPLKPSIAPAPDVRLYALNCGEFTDHDLASFSDAGVYPHKSMNFVDPCFLIKHPEGWMLWDTGVGDQYVGRTVEDTEHDITITAPLSLVAQLKQLGLTPDDIKYVGLSHGHFDHVGNATLFPHATWLMQRSEYQSIQKNPLPKAVIKDTFQALKSAPKTLLDGDYDVFGDGTVQILSTPGHTPGHQSLELRLAHQGVVILSGDLYHLRKSYLLKQIPVFNTSREDTLSSMARIDRLLEQTRGRLIVQHDAEDFAALPKIPKFLN